MNIAQLKQDLKDLEEGLDELPEEFKDDIRAEIKDLKAQIADAEKQEASKDKMKEAAEKKIDKLEGEMKSPKTSPKVKAAVKKSIEAVKKQVKEAVKEDIKERKEKPVKAAAKKAAPSGAKRGRPAAKKAAPKKVVKRKSKAAVKYEKALTNLQKLVNRTKELKAKYAGKGVDLDKDAQRKAKPFGWRLRGKNSYRRPTKAEIKSGEAYWEGRPNRADVKRAKYPKLEKGGMMAKGGMGTFGSFVYEIWDNGILKKEEIVRGGYSNLVKEMASDEAKRMGLSEVRVRKLNNASSGMMAKGGRTKKRTKSQLIADKRFKALKAGKRVSEDGNVYYENRENRSDVNRRLRLAKGGRTKKRTKAQLIADKRFKALKAGRRVSEDGNVYYESRENRSDVNRRLRLAKGGRTPKRTKAAIIADKRFKAKKAGRRISEDGNVYYENRANRSDVSRRDRI